MKKIVFLLASVMIFIVGCNEEPRIPDHLITDGYDEKGIQVWDDKDYIFDHYYTSIDTTSYLQANPAVWVRFVDKNDPAISWKINDIEFQNEQLSKEWNANYQMWVTQNKPFIEGQFAYKFGDKITASISFTNGTNGNREAVIKERKFTGNFFGINYGMTKKEGNDIEFARLKEDFRELDPNIAYIPKTTYIKMNYPIATVYTFKDNLLVETGEYAGNFGTVSDVDGEKVYTLVPSILETLKNLGLDRIPEFTEEGKLKENYTWDNGKIVFTLQMRNDLPLVTIKPGEYMPCLGISFKKKE